MIAEVGLLKAESRRLIASLKLKTEHLPARRSLGEGGKL